MKYDTIIVINNRKISRTTYYVRYGDPKISNRKNEHVIGKDRYPVT